MINRIALLCTLSILFSSPIVCSSLSFSTDDVKSMYKRAVEVSLTDPEQAIYLLNKCVMANTEMHDSIMLTECLRTISEIYRMHLNFSKSYDYAWQVLTIAEELNNPKVLNRVYENIGMLYFIFGQHTESESFLHKSLNISKELYDGSKERGQELISRYFNLVMLYNQIKDTDRSKKYLDTCFMYSERINQDKIGKGFLSTELANIYFINGEYKKAEVLLYEIIIDFENINNHESTYYTNNKGYLVILYNLMGDAKAWQEKFTEATLYYKKGLDAISKYNAHKVLEADFMYKLSDIYKFNNDYKAAYDYLYRSKVLNDSIFGSKSIKNSELLEIKNKNREELTSKNIEIAQKDKELLEKEKYLTKVIMFASIFISVLIVVILLIQNLAQRKRHKIKQEISSKVLREKNKELTSYTLQFVEKEKAMSELIKFINDNIKDSSKKRSIIDSSKSNRSNYWDEFNKRFISVNQNFYKQLSEKYPELTSTDLKHCALIKLNFSAKEMAHLLGISASSVHMSHHRLRKKMNLDRSVNLSNFISGI